MENGNRGMVYKVKFKCERCGYDSIVKNTDAVYEPHKLINPDLTTRVIGNISYFFCKNCGFKQHWDLGYKSNL